MTQSKTEVTSELQRSLGLFSALSMVAGSMIGSGIFIVSADIARQVQSPGLLLWVWVFTGLLTVIGAASFGKLAAYLPKAGGQYVYLRAAWGDGPAFLYGWSLLTVIQTGTVAAVAMAFAKYLGIFLPAVSSTPVLAGLPFTPQQGVAVSLLLGLTAVQTLGVQYGARIQNIFTTLKVLALLGVLVVGWTHGDVAWQQALWTTPAAAPSAGWDILPLFAVATVGALFSSDAWNNVTFIAGEIANPRKNLPKALVLGTGLVVLLYLLVNVAYLNLLPLSALQQAPEDRVASAALSTVYGDAGAGVMAAVILVSTFGCLNGMLLAGARVFYAMAQDGLLFRSFGGLHPQTQTPNASLWIQGGWACVLALSGQYGQLLDFVIFTTLLFYILTMLGLLKLGRRDPEGLGLISPWSRVLPWLYIAGVAYVAVFLLVGETKWFTSLMGLLLTATGWPLYWVWRRFGRA